MLVFLVFNVNLNLVTNLQVGVVTELRSRNDTIALVADVNNHFLLVDRDDSSLDNFVILNLVQCVVVGFRLIFFAHAGACAILKLFPIEVVQWLNVLDVV